MSQRREYDMSFKLDAVRLVEEQGYSVPEASKSLGISNTNLYKWRQQYQEGRLKVEFKRAQPTEAEAKLRKLEAEVKKLKVENEILKKAAAYFAKEQL